MGLRSMNKPARSRIRARPFKPPQPPNTLPPPWRPSSRAREPAAPGCGRAPERPRGRCDVVEPFDDRGERLKATTQGEKRSARLSREGERPKSSHPFRGGIPGCRLCQHTGLATHRESITWSGRLAQQAIQRAFCDQTDLASIYPCCFGPFG